MSSNRFSKISTALFMATILLSYQNCGPVHQAEERALASQSVQYSPEVKSMLLQNCVSCHAHESEDASFAVTSGWINADSPETSSMLARMRLDMPPSSAGGTLSPTKVAIVEAWLTTIAVTPSPAPSPSPAPAPAPTPAPAPAASKFSDVNKIIQSKCLSCHGAGSGSGDLSSYASLLATTAKNGQKYVVSKSPSTSALYNRLNASGGSIMPKAGALAPADIAVFQSWINDGALNN